MTLREKLEILRGEPIEVFDGDPMDIPCIEQSDIDRLCKCPVVSVQMCTYNHEPYIRQAIEGVMMQKTDFEFELVIGEDCSQDNTREICFEYQKRYPDKIRVLWWHENVSKFGGNSRRVNARCRGEFIAFCEGDDYWIDPYKLQKQVDLMRAKRQVSICFTSAHVLIGDSMRPYIMYKSHMDNGVNSGHTFVKECSRCKHGFTITASALLRKEMYNKAMDTFEILRWRLCLGDLTIWMALGYEGDVWFDESPMVVYRRHSGNITASSLHYKIERDAAIVRLYFEFIKGNGIWRFSRQVFYLLDALMHEKMNSPFPERRRECMRIIKYNWKCMWFWHIASMFSMCVFLFGNLSRFSSVPERMVDISRRAYKIPGWLWRIVRRRLHRQN